VGASTGVAVSWTCSGVVDQSLLEVYVGVGGYYECRKVGSGNNSDAWWQVFPASKLLAGGYCCK
jgi:hypothetical protein